MENFNNVPSQGKFGDSIAVVNENFLLAQQEMEMLRQIYNSLSQSQPIPVTTLPATGEAGKIYRLAGTNSYADYMYVESDLTTPIKMAEYDNATDDEPTPNSNNLVKSGGVQKMGVKNLNTAIPEPGTIVTAKGISYTSNVKARLSPDGTITPDSSSNYYVKGYSVKGNCTYYVAGRAQRAYALYVVKDEQGNVLDSFTMSSTATLDMYITTLAGASQIYIQYHSTNGPAVLREVSKDAYDASPEYGSGNVVSSHGVYNKIRTECLLTNKGFYIDDGFLIDIPGGGQEHVYRRNTNYAALWIKIDNDQIDTLVLHGKEDDDKYRYYSSYEISVANYLGANNTGKIPAGSVVCIIDLQKSLYPNGFDSLYLERVFQKEEEPVRNSESFVKGNGIFQASRQAAGNFQVIRNKALNLSTSGGVSYTTSSTLDSIMIFLPPSAGKVSVLNAVQNTGTFFYFSSVYEVSNSTYIGSNTSGVVPDESVLCITNISKSHSDSDYYNKVSIQYTDKENNVDSLLREKTITELEPDSILENKAVINNRTISDSTHVDVYVYANIDSQKQYVFNGKYTAGYDIYPVSYWDENDVFIAYDLGKGKGEERIFEYHKLNVPSNTYYIKINVVKSARKYFSIDEIVYGDYYDFKTISTGIMTEPLKVVVKSDKSFYVRHQIDDNNDGILSFGYYTPYAFNKNNSIQFNSYKVGDRDETDSEILSKTSYHHCSDCLSGITTANFGPLSANHGYCIPRVVIQNHGLTSTDIGTEWIDQNSYHYTIGNIDGDYIYLLPVIYKTGVAGEETRDWKWYTSPYPTQITKVESPYTVLAVDSHSRWDLQVSEMNNVRILINGQAVGAGTYYCSEAVLSYEQVCYNPINIETWFPLPEYEDTMLKHNINFTISGDKGFLSVTMNEVFNNLYPFPLQRKTHAMPMSPLQMGDYKPNFYIPKIKKTASGIDFSKEFISLNGSGNTVEFYRNSSDLVDVNDIPDRIYCYMKDDSENILFGCAGGDSLVRGISVKNIRNNYINTGSRAASWNPSAGNKFYPNVIADTGETDNMFLATFINEFEGYMCWYKPTNGVHCFYHRTKEGYVVYIHTNQTINKGYATLPDFMNNLSVNSIVEQTDGITLHASTIVNGKIFFSSDNSEKEYNWVVFILK